MNLRSFLGAAVLCFLTSHLLAQGADKVVVSARLKAAKPATKTGDARALEINLTNPSSDTLASLEVKWTFFGHDLKTDEMESVATESKTISMTAGHSELVNSAPVTFSAAKGKPQKPAKGAPAPIAKSAEPATARFGGWGVRVYQGGTVVGEAYSSPDLKERY